ncbi:YheC/YheD family protein [Gorillibacterium sp. sgz5001074]|uniref:YheC/YheD family protein n=1 Tax=Gorillibacterium sp. sgz5001074 TaxID=3446695 RepID=UPI003F667CB2
MGLLGQKYPWSKWKKHLALVTDPELAAHLPETVMLEEGSLHDFLRRFPAVYVKPSYGGGGKGIMKLERSGHYVTVKTSTKRFRVPLPAVYPLVRKLAEGKSYIIQQGIDLLSLEERSIDFRTLLLKPDREWQFMGTMGKWGVKEQIVTNHCRGGAAIRFREALEGAKGLSEEELAGLEERLKSLSLRIAEALNKKFPLVAELGLDIGIDADLQLWLIEANTRPQYHLFSEHADETLYKRIDGIIRRIRLPLKKPAPRSG